MSTTEHGNGSKALKAGVWYTICNFIVKVASFVTMPIFTRLLTKGEVGQFSNITSWVAVLAIIVTFDLYSSVSIARFDFKEEIDDYIASCLVLGTLITAGCFIIVVIFKDSFVSLFSIDDWTINIIFTYLLVYPAVQMFQIRNRINYKYKTSVSISLLSVVISVGGSLACVFLFQNRLIGRIIGYYIPLMLLNFVIYVMCLMRAKRISKKFWRYALVICMPLVWHNLAGNILSSSDRIIITKLCGSEANGLYSIAYSCAIIVSVLWSSMNQAWSPWAYEMMDAKKYRNLKRASIPYILFFLFVVFNFMLIAPELLLIIGGKTYIEAQYVIPPVMVGYVFQFIYSLYVNIEFYHKKQRMIAIGTLMAALVNIFLNYIFIPVWGYVAAAYTTLIGYILMFCFHFLSVKKLGKIYWYSSRFNLGILALCIIVIPIFNALYSVDLVRYIVLGVEIITVFILLCIWKTEMIILIKTRNIMPLKQKILKTLRVYKGEEK